MCMAASSLVQVAYVYDYSTATQYTYLNGMLDSKGYFKFAYKGTVGNLTIGTNGMCYPDNHWDGCIDQVVYFSRAKR
jgi:hypothetical protein